MAGMLSLCHIELLSNVSRFLKGCPLCFFSIFNLVHNVFIAYIDVCLYLCMYICLLMLYLVPELN